MNVTGETRIRIGAGISTKRIKTEGLRKKQITVNEDLEQLLYMKQKSV